MDPPSASVFAGGQPSQNIVFVLDNAAVNDAITLTPTSAGLVFEPTSMVVAEGSTQSEAFTVTAMGSVVAGSVDISVALEGGESNNNELPLEAVTVAGLEVSQQGISLFSTC